MDKENKRTNIDAIKDITEALDKIIKTPDGRKVLNSATRLTSFDEEIDSLDYSEEMSQNQCSPEFVTLLNTVMRRTFLLSAFICVRTDKKITMVFEKQSSDLVPYTKCIFCNALEHTCLIDSEEGTYTCSSCKESGTIIDFYAKYRNVTISRSCMILLSMSLVALEVVKEKLEELMEAKTNIN